MNRKDIYGLELNMWNAARKRSSSDFLKVVSEDAVMVCGGYRCTGKEYADIVSAFDCKSYSIEHFEIVNQDENSIQVHYVIHLEVNAEENHDLAGTFHITTTWKSMDGIWKVVFNSYCSRATVPRGVFAQNARKSRGQQARNCIKCSFCASRSVLL